MTDKEQESFEAHLRSIKPASPPDDLMARLRSPEPMRKARTFELPRREPSFLNLLRLVGWAVPLVVVALAATLLWRGDRVGSTRQATGPVSTQDSIAAHTAAGASEVLEADDVQIGQELVSSFDAVARLPSGEPVRFRLENWRDQVVLSDKSRGVSVESRTPRVEVMAVRFETY